jgi:hypothetical protein
LGTDGDFAVVADPDAGLLAPHVKPPGALGSGADDGAFVGAGLLVGRVRGVPEFAVDFVLVGVEDELVEERIGGGVLGDVFCGEEGDEAFLPVVVAAFDFAFGLRGWGVAEFDAVEVKGRAELGEGVWVLGVEDGMVVHVKGQREAVGLEDAGEEVEVGEEGFSGIEARAGVEAGGVVEDFQEDLFVGAAVEEGVGCGVVLPEGAVVAGLPTFDGFAEGFVAGVGVELVLDGPAADAGAVGFEVEAAMEFAGDGAVGGGWFRSEEFGGQCGGVSRPGGMMISAGDAGRPGVGLALGAGPEVIGVKFVEAGMRQSQFGGGADGAEVSSAEAVEDVTDEWRRQTFAELKFFIAARITEGRGIYRMATDAGRASRAGAEASPTCRLSDFRRRSGCVPAEPYPPLKRGKTTIGVLVGNGDWGVFRFCSHTLFRF